MNEESAVINSHSCFSNKSVNRTILRSRYDLMETRLNCIGTLRLLIMETISK